jgi:hypothetical protein
MKALFSAVTCLLAFAASAQYYYKDIMGTRETADLIGKYRNHGVQGVSMKSYTINNTPIEALSVQQNFSPAGSRLLTITKNDYLPPSYLYTYFDERGRVIRTTDSTAGVVNTTFYTYNSTDQVSTITTQFGDPLAALQTDEHLWQYDAQNRVRQMLRIKNKKDSSVVSFRHDEAGNVIEEQETRRFIKEEPFYYYYDAKNRLTDIVRFNKKAGRLMPEQMFDYAVSNNLIQRTTIAPNSSDYLIWRYRFNDKGLKTREEIYNKQKELTGKVEYNYTFVTE